MVSHFVTRFKTGKPDNEGNPREVTTTREWLDASSMDGAASMPGLKTVRLFNGTPLNCVDENTFKNSITGEPLSRIRPKRNEQTISRESD